MSSIAPVVGKQRLPGLLARVVGGQTLNLDEAEAAFTEIMSGEVPPAQIAGLLVALRTRGEAPEEVAGGVRAMRAAMRPVRAAVTSPLVDTCGTGGGGFTTFNISTAAALIAAGVGVPIAKHGNRSFTSRCGSADVLEALGVPLELSPEGMAQVLERAGIVFMFAPLLHPAMRHVGPVRRELGVPTIMNLLGPLTNPAGARRQLVGVSNPALLRLIAEALLALGHEHALVVHGEPGLDELSPLGVTEGFEVRAGRVAPFRLDPAAEFGWSGFDPADLAGGEPAENAHTIREILAGRGRPAARAAVALNAGAALFLGGRAASIADGLAEAERALDRGAGLAALDRLREAAQVVAAAEAKTAPGRGA